MNIALWIVQILLALAFLAAGIMKIVTPVEKAAVRMKWVLSMPAEVVKLIGVLEVLGAIGLILPAVTGVWPWLTPLAALGLVLTMAGAALTHVRLAEVSQVPPTIVLPLLAAFGAYGRYFVASF